MRGRGRARAARNASGAGGKLARPILVGRPSVVEARIKRFGLAIKAGRDFDLVNPEDDPRYRSYVQSYINGRRTLRRNAGCRTYDDFRTNATVIAALAVIRGEADAMLCGIEGSYIAHLRHIREIIGYQSGVSDFAALSLMISSKGAFFIADTQVRPNPSAEDSWISRGGQRFTCTALASPQGIAFVSHSDFGSYDTESRARCARLQICLPSAILEIEADGEMQGDSALSEAARELILPHSRLKGVANILIMPNLDAGNAAYQMIKVLADALPVGPSCSAGTAAHVLTPSVTARGILNMTAVAAVEAQERAGRQQPRPVRLDRTGRRLINAQRKASCKQRRPISALR